METIKISVLLCFSFLSLNFACAQKTPDKGEGKATSASQDLAPAQNHANEIVARVMGNTLLTLYHELAHALIDIYGLPMLGREEDAADNFALVELIAQIRSPETSASTDAVLAEYGRASAIAWYQAAQEEDAIERGAYFGPHALHQQRMFQTACLLTGAEPELFEGLGEQLGIDGYYFLNCEAAFQEAYDGWVYTLDTFGAFDRSLNANESKDLIFTFKPPEEEAHVRWATQAEEWIYWQEVQRHFSASFLFDTPISVTFETCGEENAYYYPEEQAVVMCYDLMEAYARRLLDPAPAVGLIDAINNALKD